jgi:hypothetical protein
MPQKRSVPRVCERCGKHFLALPHSVKVGLARYCSHRCAMTKYTDADVVTDPQTGCSVRPGCRNKNGYVKRVINKRHTYAHVVAWEAVHGPVPSGFEIDHECRNRACENVDHLRLATDSQNQGNRAADPNGTSHYKGVSWATKGRHRWRAAIADRYIGAFATEEDAARAYDAAAVARWGEFALLNFPPTGRASAIRELAT